MSENEDSGDFKKLIESMPAQPEIEAYKTEEMIVCDKCKRKNPPNRLECLYCGVDLKISEEQSHLIKPALRKIEGWKNGVNLIYIADGKTWDAEQIREAEKMTRLGAQVLSQIAGAGKSLPIARVESSENLEIAQRRFHEIGIETLIFKDENFDLESNPKRLRTIEFADDKLKLTDFNSNEIEEIDRSDLFLIVIGALFERKIESTENYKRKGDNKVLETSEISADEMLIDIYTKENQISYRIEGNGFDFSFLGSSKAFVVNENMKLTIEKLRAFASAARFDEDYLRVRGSLGQVWEVAEKTDTKGIHRKSFGKFNKEQIVQSDNLEQFTRYSRLQWHLLKKENS